MSRTLPVPTAALPAVVLPAVALLVAAVATGCGAAGSVATAPSSPARTTVNSSPTVVSTQTYRPDPFDVATGWKAISSAGLQFAVPKDWPVMGALGCEKEPAFRVERGGGAVAACGHVDDPKATVVGVAGTQESLGTTTLPDGRTRINAAVKGSTAMLTATGPDRALLEKVVATLRRVDVDLAGCPTMRPDRPAWDRPAAGPAVRFPEGSGVAVCVYDEPDGRLAASAFLEGDPQRALVKAVATARPGAVPDNTKDCAQGLAEDRDVLLLLSGVDSTTPYWAHFQNCTGRYLAMDGGVSQVTAAQLKAIFDPLTIGYAFTGDLPQT